MIPEGDTTKQCTTPGPAALGPGIAPNSWIPRLLGDSSAPRQAFGAGFACPGPGSGAAALGAEAKTRAESYREQAAAKSKDWIDDAKAYGDQAKVKAAELAVEGKTKASDALSGLGKIVSDNAAAIDEKLGSKYGDYARTASRKMQETAAKIDAKDLEEIGEDAREFVRKSPGLAVGLAAVAGFVVARMFTRSK